MTNKTRSPGAGGTWSPPSAVGNPCGPAPAGSVSPWRPSSFGSAAPPAQPRRLARPASRPAPDATHAGGRRNLVLDLRRRLHEQSDLGLVGAEAIREELQRRGVAPLPSVRTIGRIPARRGALDAQSPRPPARTAPGWYLPDLARRRSEPDSFNVVEGLVIADGPRVEVLNGVSPHGGLVVSWPRAAALTAQTSSTT